MNAHPCPSACRRLLSGVGLRVDLGPLREHRQYVKGVPARCRAEMPPPAEVASVDLDGPTRTHIGVRADVEWVVLPVKRAYRALIEGVIGARTGLAGWLS